MGRPTLVMGNWKMNLDPSQTREFFRSFSPQFPTDPGPEILIFPPALSLASALEARPKTPPVALGVQNIHWEVAGAYTGEISVPMARAAGARLQHFYPVSALADGQGMNITVQSYDGNLDFGIIACRKTVPRVQRLIDHLEASLAELEEMV